MTSKCDVVRGCLSITIVADTQLDLYFLAPHSSIRSLTL